jgi:hypothetical protein
MYDDFPYPVVHFIRKSKYFRPFLSSVLFVLSPAEYKSVLRNRSRNEPHNFGGAGAVTICGSGSKADVQHRLDCYKLSQNETILYFFFSYTVYKLLIIENSRNKQFQSLY